MLYEVITFGIPAQLKAWVDLICRAGVTFRYTEQGPEGLLQGKRLLLVVAAGGLHRDSATDLALAHIKTVLGFIGLTQVEVAYAQGLNMGPEIRRGLAELNGEGETVGGIIIVRYGANARQVIQDVKTKLEQLKRNNFV